MTTLILDSAALKATAVQTTEDTLVVELADGRSISAPLGWYPRLFHGTVTERGHFRFIAGGEGILEVALLVVLYRWLGRSPTTEPK